MQERTQTKYLLLLVPDLSITPSMQKPENK